MNKNTLRHARKLIERRQRLSLLGCTTSGTDRQIEEFRQSALAIRDGSGPDAVIARKIIHEIANR